MLLLLAITIYSCKGQKQDDMTTYYFIRHAEKDQTNPQNHDPELTEEGIARTAKWQEVFKEVPLDMVYSSKYKRAHDTAKPIADDHDLPFPSTIPKNLMTRIFRRKPKEKQFWLLVTAI